MKTEQRNAFGAFGFGLVLTAITLYFGGVSTLAEGWWFYLIVFLIGSGIGLVAMTQMTQLETANLLRDRLLQDEKAKDKTP